MKKNYRVSIMELLSDLVMVVGTVLDQVSTNYVLLFPGGYEGNALPAWLISMNLGFLLDLLVVPALILITNLLYRKFGYKAIALPVFNIVFGARRFHAFFNNLHILTHYII